MLGKTHLVLFALMAVSYWAACPEQVLAAETPCVTLRDAPPSRLAAYLKSERASFENVCVLYAIGQLGKEPDLAAAAALAEVLDFEDPDYAKSNPWLPGRRLPEPLGEYPAVRILLKIGPAASPEIIRVIGNLESSDLLRKNAMVVLRFIHRGEDAAAPEALASAARALGETDRPRSERLLRAAREAAFYCIDATLGNAGVPTADAKRKRCGDILHF